VRFRFLRERLRTARPMLAGRPHEAAGNGSPRWMAAGPHPRVHRTRPTGRLARHPRRWPAAQQCSGGDWGTLGAPGRGRDAMGVPAGNDFGGGLSHRMLRPYRRNGWLSASGSVAGAARRLGIVSTVASPIVGEGRLWGAICTTARSSDWSRSDWQRAPRRPTFPPTGATCELSCAASRRDWPTRWRNYRNSRAGFTRRSFPSVVLARLWARSPAVPRYQSTSMSRPMRCRGRDAYRSAPSTRVRAGSGSRLTCAAL
jgi:hypothetical protein